MTTEKINENQASLPSTTFGQDMSTMLNMGANVPQAALSGAVNAHMAGQMDNTSADMESFPDQSSAFKANGIASMVNGVGALHEKGGLGMVDSTTWQNMSGFGAEMSDALGFDPSVAAGGDLSVAQMALGQAGGKSTPSAQTSSSSPAQAVAQNGVDGMHSAAKTAAKLGGAETDVASGVSAAANVGDDVTKVGGKALSGISDLAKSPAGKMLGKAALPLGLVGGAVALGSDAGKFTDALTDPLDGKKWGAARDALREDLPIPGAPLVIDAVTDPSKIVDAGKDIGKAITHPSVDNFKKAGSKVLDELGF